MDEAQKQKLAKALAFKANPLKTFTEENEKVIQAIEEIKTDSQKIVEAISQLDQTKANKNEVEIAVQSVEMRKGDRGFKGEKGDAGEKGKDGKDGINGKDGTNGKDGKDGIDGKDGLNAVVDYSKVSREIDEKLLDVKDSPEEIRNKLELLKDEERLDASAIKGLKEFESKVNTTIINQSGGGSKTFNQLLDVPNSYSGQGAKVVKVKATEDGLEFGVATDTDEKVKLSATDPTAGYLEAKVEDGTFDKFLYDTTYTITGSEPVGTTFWDSVEGTLSTKLSSEVTLQHGRELHFYGKAVGNIADGDLCQYAGVQGDHILIKKAVVAEIVANPFILVGVATETFTNGNFGRTTWFGKINGIYTKTPANQDSANWVAGDQLYLSNTTGQLTKTEPVAPEKRISVGFVIKAQTGSAKNGIIEVAPEYGMRMQDLDDVNGTALTADGQIPTWHNTEKYFDFDKNINDYLKLDQTTPQTVSNGAPIFAGGINVGSGNFTVVPDGTITTQKDIWANVGGADLYIGGLPADRTYAGIWLGQASPSATNYVFLANSTSTLFNTPTNQTMYFRVGNTSIGTLNKTGLAINNGTTGVTTGVGLILGDGSFNLIRDNQKINFGAAQDASIAFDGNSLNIIANAVTAADALEFTAGSYTFKVPANTDLTLNFTGTTNSGVLTWMEDEDYFLFGDNVNLGANSLDATGGTIKATVIVDNNSGVKVADFTSPFRIFYDASEIAKITLGQSNSPIVLNEFVASAGGFLKSSTAGEILLDSTVYLAVDGDGSQLTNLPAPTGVLLLDQSTEQSVNPSIKIVGSYPRLKMTSDDPYGLVSGMVFDVANGGIADWGINNGQAGATIDNEDQSLAGPLFRMDIRPSVNTWALLNYHIGDHTQLDAMLEYTFDTFDFSIGKFKVNGANPSYTYMHLYGDFNIDTGTITDTDNKYDSIDTNNRVLYANDGTTPSLDWNSGNVLVGTQIDLGQKFQVYGTTFRFGEAADMFRMESNGDVIVGSMSDSGDNFQVAGTSLFMDKIQLEDAATYLENNSGDVDLYTTTEKTLELQTSVWNDANVGSFVLQTGGSLPGIVEWKDNTGANTGLYTRGFDVGEQGSGCIEIPHDYKEGTDLVFHVHWGGNDAPTGTDNVKWQVIYSINKGETTFNPVTTDDEQTAYDTRYELKRTDITTITGTNLKIGDQLTFTLKRIAASANEYGGEALLETVGFHYECDTLGSRQIGTK